MESALPVRDEDLDNRDVEPDRHRLPSFENDRNFRRTRIAFSDRARSGRIWVGIIGAALGVLGCSRPPETSSLPLVLVTIQPLAYFVRGVAGERVRVETLLPPGANPHSYEPGISQLRSLDEATLLVTVGHAGLTFEQAILDRLPQSGSLTVLDGFANADSGSDPHLWLSPPHTRVLVRALAQALGEILPDESESFAHRADSLEAKIDVLDNELRLILGKQDQSFYVFHDSWGTFAHTYGLRQIAIEQEGHEPGPEQIASVIHAARNDSVRTIFAEPHSSRQSAELVASEIGAEVVLLDPMASDWSDNLIKVATAIVEASAR